MGETSTKKRKTSLQSQRNAALFASETSSKEEKKDGDTAYKRGRQRRKVILGNRKHSAFFTSESSTNRGRKKRRGQSGDIEEEREKRLESIQSSNRHSDLITEDIATKGGRARRRREAQEKTTRERRHDELESNSHTSVTCDIENNQNSEKILEGSEIKTNIETEELTFENNAPSTVSETASNRDGIESLGKISRDRMGTGGKRRTERLIESEVKIKRNKRGRKKTRAVVLGNVREKKKRGRGRPRKLRETQGIVEGKDVEVLNTSEKVETKLTPDIEGVVDAKTAVATCERFTAVEQMENMGEVLLETNEDKIGNNDIGTMKVKSNEKIDMDVDVVRTSRETESEVMEISSGYIGDTLNDVTVVVTETKREVEVVRDAEVVKGTNTDIGRGTKRSMGGRSSREIVVFKGAHKQGVVEDIREKIETVTERVTEVVKGPKKNVDGKASREAVVVKCAVTDNEGIDEIGNLATRERAVEVVKGTKQNMVTRTSRDTVVVKGRPKEVEGIGAIETVAMRETKKETQVVEETEVLKGTKSEVMPRDEIVDRERDMEVVKGTKIETGEETELVTKIEIEDDNGVKKEESDRESVEQTRRGRKSRILTKKT